jgi:hypothetical protein
MPITAFSSSHAIELDTEQLLKLMNVASIEAITSEQREFIRGDILCSCCGVSGAQIVGPSKSHTTVKAVRQPHFRFRNPTDQDAHLKACEFYKEESLKMKSSLINFADEKSDETRFVRSLVCKGIENGIFSQKSIHDMRQWFFELKCNTGIRMTTTPEAIVWMEGLCKVPTTGRTFQPSKAEKYNFKWKCAAIDSFAEDHSDLLEFLQKRSVASKFPNSSFKRAKVLSVKHFEQEVWDTSILRPYYKKSLDLAHFAEKHPDLPYQRKRNTAYLRNGPHTSLLALCSLLLFVSNWEPDEAEGLLKKLFEAPSATNDTLGNVMGLNPFHDYGAWEVLAIASELADRSPANLDLGKILEETEARLREEHRIWREATNE